MKMQKVLIVLLASLIVMLLCSGVASAQVEKGSCCVPIGDDDPDCVCKFVGNPTACGSQNGIWVGQGNCVEGTTTGCTQYCTKDSKCVPEATTIALLATGLICMAGYLRLRRKEE